MTDTDTMPWDVADARAELRELREEAAQLRAVAPRVAELEGRVSLMEAEQRAILAMCGAPEGYSAGVAVAHTLGRLRERLNAVGRRLDHALAQLEAP